MPSPPVQALRLGLQRHRAAIDPYFFSMCVLCNTNRQDVYKGFYVIRTFSKVLAIDGIISGLLQVTAIQQSL